MHRFDDHFLASAASENGGVAPCLAFYLLGS